jgi:hypothetical protein
MFINRIMIRHQLNTTKEKQMKKAKYILIWWDAYGDVCGASTPMEKEEADIALAAMHPSQEARLMVVYSND